MLNHPLLWLLHANMAAPKLCFKESWEFFIFPWHDSHVFAKKNHHRPADGHQKFNSTKIMGGNPQVVSSTPPKDIHPTIPHPLTLHVDPSSPSILDLGWNLRVWRFTLPRIDVAQPNKLLLWRGLALFLKQSTGLMEKKNIQFSQAMCCSKSEENSMVQGKSFSKMQGELQPGKHALEAVANGCPNRRMVNSCDSLSQNPDFHGSWISIIPNCIHPSLPTTSY